MGTRAWLLRRAMGRLRITDDVVRYLTTFQRLGETVEVQFPGELLPVGARTLFRAIRTRAAAQLGPDWVWPWWLERQLDPTAPSFVPRGHLPVLTNVTSRNWTMAGNVGSPWEAVVDPRGLVMPWFDGWSLDWWIGAEDRWRFPSKEATVRQQLVDGAPVIETLLRVPGGDAVHRVYAVPSPQDVVVVEVENQSPVPFAVAFGVRPYNPEGLAVVERIALDERTVLVDGRPAILFPKPPAAAGASTFRDGDIVTRVQANELVSPTFAPVRCEAGLAQAAFVFPVAHRTTIRIALPLSPERRTRSKLRARRRVRRLPELAPDLPAAADVARGWSAQMRRGMQLGLPAGSIADAVEANRRFLLLFHDGDEVTPGPFTYHRFWFRDAAYLLAAMGRYGFHREVTEVLRSYPRRQRVDGFFFSQRQEWDANGCAIWSIAEHWRLTRDDALVRDLAPTIARGAAWIERKRAGRKRSRRGEPALHGLLPAGVSAEHLGPFDYFYWDDFWSIRGLRDAAEMLRVAGDDRHAESAAQWADDMAADVEASLAVVGERLGNDVIPAGPGRRPDAGAIGSLVACWPLGLRPAADPRIAATAEFIRQRHCLGDAFFQSISHTGLGTYLTLQLAFVELEAGDRRALDRLDWMVRAAMPTWTWPEAIHPQLGGGCIGDGQHGWAAAELLSFVRAMLVREVAADGGEPALALCSMLPATWTGQEIEVHDAPTHHGLLSFAVRWHGERPALLWDLRPHAGTGPVRLTAPGLDRAWSSTDAKGEALLAATSRAEAPVGNDGPDLR